MGQQADSGRNASLDQKKERAAGRRARTGQEAPGKTQIMDSVVVPDGPGNIDPRITDKSAKLETLP
jgi:hypothetical protein